MFHYLSCTAIMYHQICSALFLLRKGSPAWWHEDQQQACDFTGDFQIIYHILYMSTHIRAASSCKCQRVAAP